MNAHTPPYEDPTLRWALRLTGLLLALGAAFFLMKDLVVGPSDDIAFAVATALGLLTFASSFMRTRRPAGRPKAALAAIPTRS